MNRKKVKLLANLRGKREKGIHDRTQMCPYCGKLISICFPSIGMVMKKICPKCIKSFIVESEWMGKDYDILSWVVYVQFGVKAEALLKGEFYGGIING